MTDSHNDTKEEKDLKPHEGNWTERKKQVTEHPPTGAPKKGSLLKDLADEALSKGRPVLVIPLDGAGHEAEAGEEAEPPHDLRLPKNTTVIFAGNEGFPAMPAAGHRVKVMERHGSLGAEVSERLSAPGVPERAREEGSCGT